MQPSLFDAHDEAIVPLVGPDLTAVEQRQQWSSASAGTVSDCSKTAAARSMVTRRPNLSWSEASEAWWPGGLVAGASKWADTGESQQATDVSPRA